MVKRWEKVVKSGEKWENWGKVGKKVVITEQTRSLHEEHRGSKEITRIKIKIKTLFIVE